MKEGVVTGAAKSNRRSKNASSGRQRSTLLSRATRPYVEDASNFKRNLNEESYRDYSPNRGLSSTGYFGRDVSVGLNIAGVASSLVTTTFGLFHVDVFLRAYKLPLPAYTFGVSAIALISTCSNLLLAWAVDYFHSTSIPRRDLVGLSGCLLAAFFSLPFFNWRMSSATQEYSDNGWGGLHFILTVSLYECMSSLIVILTGSIVTDNHHMTDKDRVRYIASSQVFNLLASFVVARVGLAVFDATYLTPFRFFVAVLAVLVALLFVIAQAVIKGHAKKSKSFRYPWRKFRFFRGLLIPERLPKARLSLLPHRHESDPSSDIPVGENEPASVTRVTSGKLQLHRVVKDFWSQKNFCFFIITEMLLEAQVTFIKYFLKTFVDQLVFLEEESNESVGATSWLRSRNACDWLLAAVGPLTQIVAIGVYFPIQIMGYPRVYSILFASNFGLAILMLTVADYTSAPWITAFLVIYSVQTGAVSSSGFFLAMSDLVMELKRKHALEGRHDEPSLAALFMGTNALFCKPIQAFLPIIAAYLLDQSGERKNEDGEALKSNLFYLLVLPPLICSCIQFTSWSYFDLTPSRTTRMRVQLEKLQGRNASDIVLDL